jgi:1,4-alpha-glucan branching enzyme
MALVRDLNALMREQPALHQLDSTPEGFEWISHDDATHSMLAFVRHPGNGGPPVLVVCNFTPVVRHGWRIGVPRAGTWTERLNTDSAHYGGSNVGLPLGAARSEPIAAHGRADSISVTLPPLATVFYTWTD